MPFVAIAMAGRGDPTLFRWIAGGSAMIAGESLRLWGVAAAGAETRRRTYGVTRLVTHGPFAHVRNPIYLGNLLLWLGIGVAAGSTWFVPLAASLFAVEYGLIVRFEERLLGATFGAAYEQYCALTPRWMPRWRRSRLRGPLGWAAAARRETVTLALIAAALAALLGRRLLA